jgi:outer membrane protein assembly factor BamA
VYRNLFGRAEKIRASMSYGDQKSRSFDLTFEKPRFYKRSELSVSLSSVTHNYMIYSSFREIVRGLNVRWSDQKSRHTLGYELAWRELVPTHCTTERNTDSDLGRYTGPSLR